MPEMATATQSLEAPPRTPVLEIPGAAGFGNGEEQLEVSGARKVAIVLATLDNESCAAILRKLSEKEVHDITKELARLADATDKERLHVLKEFISIHDHGPGALHNGGIEFATSLLTAAFGPEAGSRIAERVLKSLGMEAANMDSLQKADPQALARVIHGEHPQTIALILAHVGPSHAAKLLSSLPAALRAEVAQRMAALDQISPEVVGKIARSVSSKLRLTGETSVEAYGGVSAVADVLNRLDSSSAEEILAKIAENEPPLGESIRNLMFVFEDLLKVDQEVIKFLLGAVDRKILVTALKGASAKLKALFLSSMSNNAAQMLTEDLDAMGPVKIRTVDEAQQQVIAVARQLETAGKISLRPSTGDQMVQ